MLKPNRTQSGPTSKLEQNAIQRHSIASYTKIRSFLHTPVHSPIQGRCGAFQRQGCTCMHIPANPHTRPPKPMDAQPRLVSPYPLKPHGCEILVGTRTTFPARRAPCHLNSQTHYRVGCRVRRLGEGDGDLCRAMSGTRHQYKLYVQWCCTSVQPATHFSLHSNGHGRSYCSRSNTVRSVRHFHASEPRKKKKDAACSRTNIGICQCVHFYYCCNTRFQGVGKTNENKKQYWE